MSDPFAPKGVEASTPSKPSQSIDVAAYETEMGTVCDMPNCTAQATHILTCHQIDHCKDRGAHPSGEKAFLFCPEHSKGIGDNIAARVLAMQEAVAQQNSILECNQCHMKITKLSQVLTVEHLFPLTCQGVDTSEGMSHG